MKIIFIAGKYTSREGEWQLQENIRRAELAALFVWRNGGAAICPHKNAGHFGGAPGTDRDTWIRGDIAIIERCDAVYALPDWQSSAGATREIQAARDCGIPVVFEESEVLRILEQD